MRKVLSIWLVCSACRLAPEPPPPSPEPSPSQPRVVAPTQAEVPAPTFAGEPVAFTPPQTLHVHGDFVVELQRWRFDGREGKTWRVRVPRSGQLAVRPAADVVDFASLWPDDSGPWAAINGGFYEPVPNDKDRLGRAMGLVVADGQRHSKLTRRGGSGVVYVDETGAHIVHRRAYRANATHALQSIDRLADEGETVVTRKEDQQGALRSAVAVGTDHLWLIVSAAENDISVRASGIQLSRSDDGLPLWAFADYVLASTDAQEILNLDGGVSTQLAVRDGDFTLNLRGVRGTINALVLRP